MSYGVTSAGFAGKPLEVAKTELEAELRAAFGAGINLAPQSVLAKLAGIFSERETLLWELAEGVYTAFTADGAGGASLDHILSLTGARRLAATRSTVTVTATGTPATVLPAGRVVSVSGSGARFRTLAEATIGGGGTVAVECEAEETGPAAAAAGTLTVIETPVAGWTSVTNALDAELGRNIETDAAARVRRDELLALGGSSVVDAIRSKVRAVDGVLLVRVFENTTPATVDGIPPHAVEALVLGGSNNDVAQAIWESRPGGILAHGAASGTATDTEDEEHSVAFTRPEGIAIHVEVDLTKDALTWPSDGVAQVKAAIVAYGLLLGLGADVVASALSAQAFKVAGVIDVTAVRIGLATEPEASTTLAIGPRQRAVFDTSRIAVEAT